MEKKTTFEDGWAIIIQLCDTDVCVMMLRAGLPTFYGPVTLPY